MRFPWVFPLPINSLQPTYGGLAEIRMTNDERNPKAKAPLGVDLGRSRRIAALRNFVAYATKFRRARAEREHANFSTPLRARYDVRKSEARNPNQRVRTCCIPLGIWI